MVTVERIDRTRIERWYCGSWYSTELALDENEILLMEAVASATRGCCSGSDS